MHVKMALPKAMNAAQILKAPFVCNGCGKRSNAGCIYIRRLYRAAKAQSEYETLLVEAREGIPLNKESFYQTEKIISDAMAKGQHIYHIIASNNLPISKSTVYRHINKQYYSIGLGALICQGLLNLSLENLTVILMFQKLLKRIVLTKILLRFVRKIPIFLLWKWIRLLAEQGEK